MSQLTQTPILLSCNVIYSAHVMACLSRSVHVHETHVTVLACPYRRGARHDARLDCSLCFSTINNCPVCVYMCVCVCAYMYSAILAVSPVDGVSSNDDMSWIEVFDGGSQSRGLRSIMTVLRSMLSIRQDLSGTLVRLCTQGGAEEPLQHGFQGF